MPVLLWGFDKLAITGFMAVLIGVVKTKKEHLVRYLNHF